MYQAGIYCRISIEEQNKEGEYSNSIHSQIQMARDYIAENKDIAEKKVYVDDGASGSNFERTEFRRMLADIELGVINMVIFKDVSRLGREHIDTNYYLGKYFPEKQIRIVSILDNYDSVVGTYDEMLEIKTLLNDMYLRDTSRKIKMTIQTKRSMGEYTPKQPPFGYVKSKTIHNHLEVDPYAAEVVRRIYKMYQNGFGCTVICRTLNEDEIPCPAKYKKEVLKTADMFIMTSRFEGLSMGLIEALSYGLPCLVTRGTYFMDEVNQFNAGIGTENSVDSISSGLSALVNDLDMLPIYSNNAKELSKKYSWDSASSLLQSRINSYINR